MKLGSPGLGVVISEAPPVAEACVATALRAADLGRLSCQEDSQSSKLTSWATQVELFPRSISPERTISNTLGPFHHQPSFGREGDSPFVVYPNVLRVLRVTLFHEQCVTSDTLVSIQP